MDRTVRFIHVADIHLGTSIRGLHDVTPEWAKALQEAVVRAWERVVNVALSRAVDFVIIAGDVFDSSRPSYGDYLRFFEGLEKLDEAGIPSYLVTGNHDPYTVWERDVSRLPQSTRLLGVNGPEYALFSRGEEPLCIIGGRSYYNQAWPEDSSIAKGISRTGGAEALMRVHPNASKAPFAIGVIHTGLEPDQSKARVKLDDLYAADVDYWACGHLHERMVLPDEANPRVVFPGCVQGRTMKETGERGCYLVELKEAHAGELQQSRTFVEFIPTSSVIFQSMRVNVTACQTLADVRRLVQAELFHENGKTHCDEMITQITLEGETTLREFFVSREILEDLRQQINNAYPSFFCDALVDKTSMSASETFESEDDGFFPRIVAMIADEQRAHEDVLINFVQNEFVKRGIPVPSSLSGRVGEFNDEAERFVLDLLRRASE